MLRRMSVALAITLALAVPARATELCAWMNETSEPGHVHALDLWLQSDTSIDFLYAVVGKGIISGPNASFSPANGARNLQPGVPAKLWHFDTTFYPPGKIDVQLEIRKITKDYYSSAQTALLAKYAFERPIPESETTPPPALAKKFCAEIIDGD